MILAELVKGIIANPKMQIPDSLVAGLVEENEKLESENIEFKRQLAEVKNGATGETPCARFCEARALDIETRNLRRENQELKDIIKRS